MTTIAPSLLGADLLKLGEAVKLVESLNLPWIHFDQMDGHFVPNISFGPGFVKAVRPATSLFLDVHLMLSKPLDYVEAFAKAGADGITVHVEAEKTEEALKRIRELGLKAGIAINPMTPYEAVLPYMDLVDMVLVMTVQPGFGGQSLKAECLEKARALSKIIQEQHRQILIEADGGIHERNAQTVIDAGVNVLVMGTGLFRADDPESIVHSILKDRA